MKSPSFSCKQTNNNKKQQKWSSTKSLSKMRHVQMKCTRQCSKATDGCWIIYSSIYYLLNPVIILKNSLHPLFKYIIFLDSIYTEFLYRNHNFNKAIFCHIRQSAGICSEQIRLWWCRLYRLYAMIKLYDWQALFLLLLFDDFVGLHCHSLLLHELLPLNLSPSFYCQLLFICHKQLFALK